MPDEELCPQCRLPITWRHGFGCRWCILCGYLEKKDMRATCLKCNAMTIHKRNDAGEIVCTICGRVLIELW